MSLKQVQPSKASQTIETKSKILKAALALFNERGSPSVTTHDIAEVVGISPGNLYYHFQNKQAIIRALFYQIEIFSMRAWWEKSPANKEVRFSDFMRFYFESISTYQFFFREFAYLLQQDTVLAKEWKRTYNELKSVMTEALEGWIEQKLIKPFASAEDADAFIETVWILAAFSQIHFEYRDSVKKADAAKQIHRIIARFMLPYHTPKGQRTIELYL